MKCNVAVMNMHDYLDGDLSREEIIQLQQHLRDCPSCHTRYEALERTDALAKCQPIEKAPEYLSDRVMKSLPSPRRPAAWTTWVRRHPAMSAAALFIVVMLSSFVSMWNQSQEFSVSGQDLEHVVIQGKKVIVPEGQKVNGDLTVVNGDVQVLGDLEGNLTVIDGNLSPLASTAHIAGQIKTIDRAVDWVWYKVSSYFGTLAYGS
ncbi:zf-HC2 domain-containing protein [Cohnella terricola]|uniref:Anti-sigma-W factor RsiW n=1 Tax=Cohnella terricola TaxID=1289167 RepID=A0A559JTX7_9BACL|nr:zf-HC2 domain-containing protein [Cohnella terricola]TVY03334.1 anti-sigma factor [Cohnella terricola]